MNKTQLIDALAARYDGDRRAAAHALQSVLDTITREVAQGERVAITGFGSFEKRVREARWMRNPRTGERFETTRTSVPKFTPGADLRNVVSGAKQLPPVAPGSAPVVGGTRSAAPARRAAPTRRPDADEAVPPSEGSGSVTPSQAPAGIAPTAAAAADDKTKSDGKKAAAKKAADKKADEKKKADKKAAAKKAAEKAAAKKAAEKKKTSSKKDGKKKADKKKTSSKKAEKKKPGKKRDAKKS